MTTLRHLTTEEINQLKGNGCSASDWNCISVADPFIPEHYRNVKFSGSVSLGTTARTHLRHDAEIPYQSGIYNASIHNVSIADDVHISDIHNYISDINIEEGCFLQNIDRISCHKGATFGVGTMVSVLNETGGREVPISPNLSAHTAYLMAMYRHDEPLTSAIKALVDKETELQRNSKARIGADSMIRNVGTITDVTIGECAIIEGATRLRNGTIASTRSGVVTVGAGVIAESFIFASGSKIEDGSLILKSFIGQGSVISRLFSAHDSLFFANCTCENGEACAIFAGPYTVTMHKSSLLIAGMFSFLNAGSGSNQSNHMYKLGPIHQGVVERGSKTTSDSYILWPARIGAFSLVMGRHVGHPDTSMLPFSYLIEMNTGSTLVPAANLRSVGTVRDAQKWPRRDRRTDPNRLDFINFNLLSPYTVSKMLNGIDLLNSIELTSGSTSEFYSYQGLTIRASSLRNGREYYGMAVDKFFGNSVLKRLENCTDNSAQAIRAELQPTHSQGKGEWIDMAGLFAPKSAVESIISDLISGNIDSQKQLNQRFHDIANDYYDMEWTWVASQFKRWWGKEISELDVNDIRAIADRWLKAVLAIDNMLLKDAKKEFSMVSQIGFGVDNSDVAFDDFTAVRGDYDSDPFVEMVKQHIKSKTALHDDLISRLK